ncbi:MAG: DSD1 family PLP-dependent enzyme [Anaerolineales bacterium]|jgi:D-serine deaminase-like pyridoxal phosphate-dependent protein
MVKKLEIGTPIKNIDTPALLVDLDLLTENINKMADAFKDSRVRVRPHIKTHKCPEIAKLQIEAGAIGITCAKVSEAEVFAEDGITDILIANQITGPVKIDRLTELAKRCELMVAVDDAKNVEALNLACQEKNITIRVLVEVNIGMNRCGVEPGEDTLKLTQVVNDASHLGFWGFQAYEGHLVLVKNPSERAQKVEADFAPLRETIEMVEQAGIEVKTVSGGGTGTYDLAEELTPLTEVQVGSYVFMDSTYASIRGEFKPSIHIVSTVVSRPVPARLVTDAGLKAMTSEFGWPVLESVDDVKMNYLSEEHAVLTLEKPESVTLIGGDRVLFLPSHVCTTVNLHDYFYVHQNGRLVDVWKIKARGCTQ